MVVHSGQPTIGYCNKLMECYPHDENHFYYEGHGRVQLDRVLHYDGESDFEDFDDEDSEDFFFFFESSEL